MKTTLKPIKDIKNENLICLDFDDCLIPWGNYNFKETPDLNHIKKETDKNSKIIADFCKENGFKIFLTTSWAMVLDDNLKLISSFEENQKFLDIMFKHFKKFVIGKDPYIERELSIRRLLKQNNFVIAIDDMPLGHIHHENYIYIKTIDGKNLKENLEKAKERLRKVKK